MAPPGYRPLPRRGVTAGEGRQSFADSAGVAFFGLRLFPVTGVAFFGLGFFPLAGLAFALPLPTAASQSISPAPAHAIGSSMLRQVLRMTSATWAGVSLGSTLSRRAASPATCGQAPLVPHHSITRYPFP